MHNELVALGLLVLTAGLLGRAGRRLGLPTIPFYMAAGVLLGQGTPGPVLVEDPEALELLATIGLVLLLFHLGVEFPVRQVLRSGPRLLAVALVYIGLNVSGGLAVGFWLGWGTPEALVIAGAMGISSSAIVTKLLIELRRLANTETPLILGLIVVEDLFLAFYLALLHPILGDPGSALDFVLDVTVSFGFLLLLFLVARFGARAVGAAIGSRDDELLTILFLGLVLAVAGVSEELGVSDAIGALMIGLVVSRTAVSERVERLVTPMRDAFAAVFFVVFGLTIDVGAMGSVAWAVLVAILASLVLNITAGIIAARVYGFNQRAAANLALTVLGRGEFSLILASLALAAGLDARIGPFVALYIFVLAVVSPLLAARSRHLARILPDWLLTGSFAYVREETMRPECDHLDQIRVGRPDHVDGCEECLAAGGPPEHSRVELRLCLICGHVGCCNDSPGRHAAAHFRSSDHPIIQTLEDGEDWRYCNVDQTLLHDVAPPDGQRRPRRRLRLLSRG
jgi:monovalent cation:H+ antiporter-2, CPA2 family